MVFIDVCFFKAGKDKNVIFKRRMTKDFDVQKDGGIFIITLPYSEKTLKKLGIKKLKILDNKLAQFSPGVYFSDMETGGLDKFSKRLEKPDGLLTFRRLIPEIAVKVIKRQGKDVGTAKVAVVTSGGDEKLLCELAKRFRFITAIGNDDELWDNIYEETGLSIPFSQKGAARGADLVIYTGKENRCIDTRGISIGFDICGERAIGADSLSFNTGGEFSKLEEILRRPLTIGEIEVLGCPYKYRLYI